MSAPRCIPLDAVTHEAVGGKAEGLARLLRDGFSVPAGFVVIGATESRLPEDLEDQYRRMGGGRVAVRSSALGEDSGDASFAGQYETVLNVEGADAVTDAVRSCLRSLASTRATAYRNDQRSEVEVRMSVVVQRMVDARAAGVLFTADPADARRDHVVIDAVAGLGDALVSGRVTPEHWVLRRDGAVARSELAGEASVLSDEERSSLLRDALDAEKIRGAPLDMEWAIDRDGKIHWLQARPITELPADLNELDTKPDPSHVYTWCNIGEMMPGAVTPLTYSVTGRGIDIGMQRAYRRSGVRVPSGDTVRYVGMYFGHLFLNLTNLSEIASDVAGSTKEQMCIAICGRDIEEIPEPRPAPRVQRMLNGVRYFRQLLSMKKHGLELEALRASLRLPQQGSAAAMFQAIDSELPKVWRAYELHLLSSSSSGALGPILVGILARGETPTQQHHAEVAALLAGATDVESADIAEGAERVIDRLVEQADAEREFASASAGEALTWLVSDRSGEAGRELARYLARHGHRAVRELELRQRGWADDPTPLVGSLQSGFRARLSQGVRRRARPRPTRAIEHPIVRRLLPFAHRSIRSREHTKSLLVHVTTAFKHAYRSLGANLVREGLLSDDDAVFFLTHEELGELVAGRRDLASLAEHRRKALAYQMGLHFPEVFRDRPDPLAPAPHVGGDDLLSGKPVSRGVVTGRARVVETLEEAVMLEAGEILIAPITDVGWTPYFNLIAGLATDVGSVVSHGAVVAREYGLPAVVNLGFATTLFKTGDMVTLDGDRGTLTRA